jgi:hypothetical protein
MRKFVTCAPRKIQLRWWSQGDWDKQRMKHARKTREMHFDGKTRGGRPLGRPRRRYKYNINTELREIIQMCGLDSSDWGDGPVAGSCEHTDTGNAGNFLNGWETVGLSRNPFHGFSYIWGFHCGDYREYCLRVVRYMFADVSEEGTVTLAYTRTAYFRTRLPWPAAYLFICLISLFFDHDHGGSTLKILCGVTFHKTVRFKVKRNRFVIVTNEGGVNSLKTRIEEMCTQSSLSGDWKSHQRTSKHEAPVPIETMGMEHILSRVTD